MDLGAFCQINDLEDIMKNNNISVPRLRGLRLMSQEKPLTKDEIEEAVNNNIKHVYEDGIRACRRWDYNCNLYEYSNRTDYLKKYFIDKEGNLRWDRVHGKNRKNVKFAIKKVKYRVRHQYTIWNKYAGRDDVLYIHARIGGNNWKHYDGHLLEKQPWFLEKVDDCFDDTYCDIYAKVKI